ncbi:MAG: TonB-dependent receptor [Cyclobacteriaceae bacterium]|nr:TonB-dependent receptor [Cyclobacteriaceae bacterium]MCB0499323.1 TonB-dependent receptor [Cyclobacteriaceae bacterium]MCB9236401.1 TonB-dependent receptor [Flammeovirgaceae bacterium]MCO5272280.1 TonB-dependent receptor [Cyclobacteriaceae bacterium]MCW5902138.1 TonB-dependent receptor [Cyclobacteriaceae bacterium]
MKKIYFSLLGTIFSLSIMAQSGPLRGKVLDAVDNKPLANANVRFAGGSGTTTDDNGMFSLPCNGPADIIVSFVGYREVRQRVENCDEELSIEMVMANQILDNVVITATSNSNHSILYQPKSISKMGEVEIQRGNGLFLDDAINTNVTGVYMSRRAVSSGQQFNIRGYGSGVGFRGANNNFDGQGYKVYLNGIPITDAEGITLMDDIDFGTVGNVEVIKGPAGSLYGLAIAGVVNLQTKKPEYGKTSIGQQVMAGSYGLQRYTTQLEIGNERASVLVNYGNQHADGFMSHNASKKDFVNMAAEFYPNPKQRINTYLGYSHSYDERGGELTIDQYDNGDYTGNPRYIKNNAHSEITSFRAGLSHVYSFSDNISNTTTFFGSGVSNNSSSAAGWTDKSPINYGLRSTLDMKFLLGEGASLSGIVGVESQKQFAQIVGYGMTADSTNLSGYNIIGDLRSNQAAMSSTTSSFTEWTLSLPHDVSITAGVGLSTMNIELDNRIYDAAENTPAGGKPSHYGITYDNMVSPHFAINKVFNNSLSAYVSYSKGYKAPVSSNIVISATGRLNTGLRPEVGNQFEVGTKGSLMDGRLNYQVALFDAGFDDKMTSVAVPLNNTTTLYSYIANGGKQQNRGLEVAVAYNAYQSATGFMNYVRPFANLTYSDFQYKDFSYESVSKTGQLLQADYSGKAVAGVSPVVANVGVDLSANNGFYGNLYYSFKDSMPITSDGAYQSQIYRLVNAKVGYHRMVSGHFDVDAYFGANNITGQRYYYMVFVNQLNDAYIPAPDKINYFGGLNLKYIF